ncbi:hypothetical protein HDU93_000648 [Gonapodya sp. JEL0774]|nr:hypothetical protein HDU93_000648 [Gonapodya sp. JEL0774]
MPPFSTLQWKLRIHLRNKFSRSAPSPLLALPPELLDLILKHTYYSRSQFRLGLPLALITRENLPTLRDPEAITDRAVRRFGNPLRAFISEGRRFPVVDLPVLAALVARTDKLSLRIDQRDYAWGWEMMFCNLASVGILRDVLRLLVSSGVVLYQLRTDKYYILDAVLAPNDTKLLRAFIEKGPWVGKEFELLQYICIHQKDLSAAEFLLDNMLKIHSFSVLVENPLFVRLVGHALANYLWSASIERSPSSYGQKLYKQEKPFYLRFTKLLADRDLLRPSSVILFRRILRSPTSIFRTLLDGACMQGHEDLVRTLLDIGEPDFARALEFDGGRHANVVALLLSRTKSDIGSDIVTAPRRGPAQGVEHDDVEKVPLFVDFDPILAVGGAAKDICQGAPGPSLPEVA